MRPEIVISLNNTDDDKKIVLVYKDQGDAKYTFSEIDNELQWGDIILFKPDVIMRGPCHEN